MATEYYDQFKNMTAQEKLNYVKKKERIGQIKFSIVLIIASILMLYDISIHGIYLDVTFLIARFLMYAIIVSLARIILEKTYSLSINFHKSNILQQ